MNLDFVYPIGSIYLSINSTNPSKWFGGTWVAWGTGRVPVGVDTSQTEFNVVEKTGGSKYLQEHTHKYRSVKDRQGTNCENTGGLSKSINKEGDNSGFTNWDDAGTAVGTVSGVTTGNSGNLQPYITCYMWKRTA